MEARQLDEYPHILLAEDDVDLRELLMFVLSRAGYRVTVCGNGLQLLETLETYPDIDLVVSDVRMPALTGLEVLESQYEKNNPPPFICMTAFGDLETHQTAARLGAAAVIDKPFDLDALVELVHSVCPYPGETISLKRSLSHE